MKWLLVCLLVVAVKAAPAPERFAFPDERQDRKLEPIITPPILPVLEHLERDPSTLLPEERRQNLVRQQERRPNPNPSPRRLVAPRPVKPKFGFSGGPTPGGVSGSVSSSFGGPVGSHSASQSFSFGFSEGFSASHSASQSSSFNGFGGSSSFSGSQASSQAASFSGGQTVTGSASQAAAFAGSLGSGSQSSSSGFGLNAPGGFNSINGFSPNNAIYDDVLDVRHRGAPKFPFPGRNQGVGRGVGQGVGRGVGGAVGRGVSAATFRTAGPQGRNDDIVAIVITD